MKLETIKNLVSARFPLIFIDTHEERRVLERLQALPWKILVWSVTKGLYSLQNAGPDNTIKPINDPVAILDHIANTPSGGAVFVLTGLRSCR